MAYETAKLIGYGVLPDDQDHPLFAVVGLWTYRGKASRPQIVGWYGSWEKAYGIKTILEDAMETR